MINYTIDERIYFIPKQQCLDNNNKAIEYLERVNDTLVMLFDLIESSENSFFLGEKAQKNLYDNGQMDINDLISFRNNNPELKEYISDSSMTLLMASLDFKINGRRHNYFKTLSFEEQFFGNRENDYEYMEDTKKAYNFDNRDVKTLDSLNRNTPLSLNDSFIDKLKLIGSINYRLSDNSKHFLLTNGDFSSKLIRVDILDKSVSIPVIPTLFPVKLVGIKYDDHALSEIEEIKTVSEAYNKANNDFGTYLFFGNDIDNGTLEEIKCPPARFYYYLKTLNDIAEYLSVCSETEIIKLTGKFGCPKDCVFKNSLCKAKSQIVLKLAGLFGCNSSCESSSTLRCKLLMCYRAWNDDEKNQSKRQFKFHLKPSTNDGEDDSDEDTIRIYFDYDESKRRIIIGMINSHGIPCDTSKKLNKAQKGINQGRNFNLKPCLHIDENNLKGWLNKNGTPYCDYFVDNFYK
ncbi:hypothetical protein FACS189479_02920 [Spirochaetia bacterium]|nr:hypothetical protein FACS189479_02920 [Spirochaetia bacterium]